MWTIRTMFRPGDVDLADRALVEVVGVEGEALPAVRILADPAGAQDAARAGLQERALQQVSRRRSSAGFDSITATVASLPRRARSRAVSTGLAEAAAVPAR